MVIANKLVAIACCTYLTSMSFHMPNITVDYITQVVISKTLYSVLCACYFRLFDIRDNNEDLIESVQDM